MRFLDLLKTSLYSIKAHKLRMFLTMSGIIIGITSTVTMKSIGDGLEHYMVTSMQDSGADKYEVYFSADNQEMGSSMMSYFDQTDVDDIKSVDGVTDAEAANNMGTSDAKMTQIVYFGKNQSGIFFNYDGLSPEMECGEWLKSVNDEKKQIVLNYDTAESLFDNVSDAVGKGVTIDGEIYEIKGVTKETKSLFDVSSYYNFMSKYNISGENKGESIISQITFKVKPGYDTEAVFTDVKDKLKSNHPEAEGKYEVYDPSSQIQIMSSVIGGITAFVTAITGIALFVGGVGVMNIMYVSVTERKREIGIRRAIGARPSGILIQFLLEAMIVTGIGGIIGIILGALLGNAAAALIPIEGFKAVITLKTLIGAASVSVLVGIIFGIVPAKNAAKMDPIKAIYQ